MSVSASGAEAASLKADVRSPETYIGYARAERFVSPGGAVENAPHDYSGTPQGLNQWTLQGDWTVAAERAALNKPGGRILYRFHARDLHLVLGPSADGKPVRFRVSIDGAAPEAEHGVDTDADGNGMITEHRLYQLMRQKGSPTDRTLEIEFLDPGAEAYAFTFG